jgi:hypothetical protein
MVQCAIKHEAGLVIASRDSDYGVTIENKSYINDHLRHEFSDRVSRKRKLVLYSSLSEALKSFDVPVSPKEEQVEKELLDHPIYGSTEPPFSLYESLRSSPANAEWLNKGVLEMLFRARSRAVDSKAVTTAIDAWLHNLAPPAAGPETDDNKKP